MAVGLISGCSGSVEAYKEDKPELDLQQYLDGSLQGQGMIQNWKGKVVSRFDFYGKAHWEDDTGTFREKMVYYNGKVDNRVWTIRKVGPHHYEGQADDVVGKADIHTSGNAMHWEYTMDVEMDDSTYRLSFDDWMFLMRDGGLLNKNSFSKFGFGVGELTLYMHKVDDNTFTLEEAGQSAGAARDANS